MDSNLLTITTTTIIDDKTTTTKNGVNGHVDLINLGSVGGLNLLYLIIILLLICLCGFMCLSIYFICQSQKKQQLLASAIQQNMQMIKIQSNLNSNNNHNHTNKTLNLPPPNEIDQEELTIISSRGSTKPELVNNDSVEPESMDDATITITDNSRKYKKYFTNNLLSNKHKKKSQSSLLSKDKTINEDDDNDDIDINNNNIANKQNNSPTMPALADAKQKSFASSTRDLKDQETAPMTHKTSYTHSAILKKRMLMHSSAEKSATVTSFNPTVNTRNMSQTNLNINEPPTQINMNPSAGSYSNLHLHATIDENHVLPDDINLIHDHEARKIYQIKELITPSSHYQYAPMSSESPISPNSQHSPAIGPTSPILTSPYNDIIQQQFQYQIYQQYIQQRQQQYSGNHNHGHNHVQHNSLIPRIECHPTDPSESDVIPPLPASSKMHSVKSILSEIVTKSTVVQQQQPPATPTRMQLQSQSQIDSVDENQSASGSEHNLSVSANNDMVYVDDEYKQDEDQKEEKNNHDDEEDEENDDDDDDGTVRYNLVIDKMDQETSEALDMEPERSSSPKTALYPFGRTVSENTLQQIDELTESKLLDPESPRSVELPHSDDDIDDNLNNDNDKKEDSIKL